jgi:hypothetical protein
MKAGLRHMQRVGNISVAKGVEAACLHQTLGNIQNSVPSLLLLLW